MKYIGTFPFGFPLQDVVQTDRSPKDIFVLGVYSSAVHAHWKNVRNETVVTALAVASEPYIFWRGDNAESIIGAIPIPKELGRLIPAAENFNGPSGKVLDDLILNPLGLERQNAWLCDLVPHSCVNTSQKKAIEREYLSVAEKYSLPRPTVPPVPNELSNEKRRREILAEIIESKVKVLIVLGDKPIEWFLSYYDNRWKKLSDFGHDAASYGKLHKVYLGDYKINVLPLAHPRQIGKLGQSSLVWYELHKSWVEKSGIDTLKIIREDGGDFQTH